MNEGPNKANANPDVESELGEDFFYYKMPSEKETIAELMVKTPDSARIKYTVIQVHAPDAEYYDGEKSAYVSRMSIGEKDKTIEKPKRLSRSPERTFRALARLTNLIKLHAHRKHKDTSSEA